MSFVKIAVEKEIPKGKGKVVKAKEKDLAVFNVNGKFFAIENTCKHAGGPLGDGVLQGSTVTCPWHGWQYDVKTGDCKIAPGVKMGCFKVKVEKGEVWVEI